MTSHQHISSSQKGFTLIEVIITLALIGIISAIGYPSLSSFMKKYNFRAAAREVLTTAMQARSNSIRDNANWQLTLDAGDPEHKFTLVDPAGTASRSHDLSSYGNGIRLIIDGEDCGNATGLTQASSLVFTGRGFGGTPGSLYLENASNDVCFGVTALANGVLRLRYFNGTNWN